MSTAGESEMTQLCPERLCVKNIWQKMKNIVELFSIWEAQFHRIPIDPADVRVLPFPPLDQEVGVEISLPVN